MLGMKLEAAKANFFDRKAVISAVDRATGRNLSKFGAFVRQRARTSIRKRKRVSAAGSPPSAHVTGPLSLRGGIFFAMVPDRRGVVIGPVAFNTPGSPTVPEVLEYGGDRVITSRRRKPRVGHYRARPYMGPAFEEEKKSLPSIWRNSVR